MALDNCDINCGIDEAVHSQSGFRRHVLLMLRTAITAIQAISGSVGIAAVSETSPAVSDAAAVEVLASNAGRLAGYIQNITSDTLWVSFGATAVANECVRVGAGQSLPLTVTGNIFKGAVSVIKDSGAAEDIIVVEAT